MFIYIRICVILCKQTQSSADVPRRMRMKRQPMKKIKTERQMKYLDHLKMHSPLTENIGGENGRKTSFLLAIKWEDNLKKWSLSRLPECTTKTSGSAGDSLMPAFTVGMALG